MYWPKLNAQKSTKTLRSYLFHEFSDSTRMKERQKWSKARHSEPIVLNSFFVMCHADWPTQIKVVNVHPRLLICSWHWDFKKLMLSMFLHRLLVLTLSDTSFILLYVLSFITFCDITSSDLIDWFYFVSWRVQSVFISFFFFA